MVAQVWCKCEVHVHVHILIQRYICKYTHIHTCTHTHIHTYTYTHRQAHTYTSVCIHHTLCVYVYMYIHMFIHMYIHVIFIYACMHSCLHMDICACVYVIYAKLDGHGHGYVLKGQWLYQDLDEGLKRQNVGFEYRVDLVNAESVLLPGSRCRYKEQGRCRSPVCTRPIRDCHIKGCTYSLQWHCHRPQSQP